jgi:manganese transport protein
MKTSRLLSVLLWAVIAGAFIGPGTVATAATAGARHGLGLLWAVLFSTATCLLLQEAAARLTTATGRDLGETLGDGARTGRGLALAILVVGAVVIGCAAYEAGNILGGVAGAERIVGLPTAVLTLALGVVAAVLLVLPDPAVIARVLGGLVAVMGLAFIATAVGLGPDPGALVSGLLLPSLPDGAAPLVLAVIGTTVVPYNLFLGSSLARGQAPAVTRFGLTVAVGLGGLVTAAIVVVGTAISGEMSFPALEAVLTQRLGVWAGALFGFGLLAAGLSSAVTAPLAAALTVQGVFGRDRIPPAGWRFRLIWLAVLVIGVVLGLADVRPIPVILLAQALNGLMLPLVGWFLLVVVNDRKAMGSELPGPWHAAALGLAVGVTVMLGASSLARAGASALGAAAPSPAMILVVSAAVALGVAVPTTREVLRRRRRQPQSRRE